jgi:outer membrane lipoprotein carrier protein
MKIYSKFILVTSTVIFFWLLMPASSLFAISVSGSETSAEVAVRLQNYYSQVESLSFSFIQTTKGQMIGRPKTGRGNGIFVRTDTGEKMRWNYNSPDRQVLISDGKTISMYFEELNQMIIAPVDQGQADILFSFFAGQGPLENSFTILDSEPALSDETEGSSTDLKVIYLVPKDSDSQITIIHLYVTAESLIRRIEFIDHFDTKTTINISNISVDPFQPGQHEEIEQLFSFTPPEGTEIIKQ